MEIGGYKVGQYHAIIRKEFADGSVHYETSFRGAEDLKESFYAIHQCVGGEVWIRHGETKILTKVRIIQGKEAIEQELLHGCGPEVLADGQYPQPGRENHR